MSSPTCEGDTGKSDVSISTRTSEPVRLKKSDDVFVWENPLHQPGGNNVPKRTPDEQTDLDFDSCEQITTITEAKLNGAPPMAQSCEEVTEVKTNAMLPPPNEFGGGNPFLMFLCITVLLQHRDHIIGQNLDYNEMAMHFDKMVRKHNVTRVLNQARQMYARYIKQHTIAHQQKHEDC